MAFLHPEYLWGLLAVLIPIIIHFFNFQRPKVVYFTNVAFLREVQSTATSRNRLKHWLILLARMAFIVALVIAFAQPIRPGESSQNTAPLGSRVALYLDNSYSLQNENEGVQLLDQAKNIAQELTRIFPAQVRFQLQTNAPTTGSSTYFYPAEVLEEKLFGVDFVSTSPSLNQTYDRQRKHLQTQGSAGHQIFWISDFQKRTLGDLESLPIDSNHTHYLIRLPAEQNIPNLVVDSVWLENPFVQANQNNLLHIRLRNTGKEAVENRLLQFFIANRQVSSRSVSLSPQSEQVLQMPFAVDSAGEKTAYLELEDYPLTFDDKHYFTLQVSPKINIVTIGGDAEARYAAQVFENNDFFAPQYFPADQVDYNALLTADMVVLAHLPDPDASLQQALEDMLQRGGVLVIIPPMLVTGLQSYAKLVGQMPERVSASDMLPLALPREDDPFYEGVFERVPANMNLPQSKPVLQWGGKPILRYRDNKLFLSNLRKGAGNLFLFASSLQTEAGNFQKHALFVPTMYRMAFVGKQSLAPLAYSLQTSQVRLTLDSLRSNQVFRLEPRTRSGQPFIPAQRVLGNQLILDLQPELLEAGHYALVRQADNAAVALLAFNISKDESYPETYTEEDLRRLFASHPRVFIYDGAETRPLIRSFSDQYIALPLWRYFLVAALLFLLLETLFIRWRR